MPKSTKKPKVLGGVDVVTALIGLRDAREVRFVHDLVTGYDCVPIDLLIVTHAEAADGAKVVPCTVDGRHGVLSEEGHLVVLERRPGDKTVGRLHPEFQRMRKHALDAMAKPPARPASTRRRKKVVSLDDARKAKKKR